MPITANATQQPGGTDGRLEIVTTAGKRVFTPAPPKSFEKPIRDVCALLELPENWDSYGAGPLRQEVVEAAIEFLLSIADSEMPPPAVCPTNRGTVQFEWHLPHVDLEIDVLSRVQMRILFEDLQTGQEWEQVLEGDTAPVRECIRRLKSPE